MTNERNDSGVVVAHIRPLPPLDQLESLWRDLEARATASFFLSWHWIGTWLVESGVQPALLVAVRSNAIVGLGLIGQDCLRLGPMRLRRIRLHQTGEADLDSIYIEYNDLLVDSRYAAATRTACLSALAALHWQEMRWAATELSAEQMPVHPNMVLEKGKTSTSPFVDLDAVRRKAGDLCALLSANTRSQIRRSVRLYQETGELRIERAPTKDEALAWLKDLRRLQEATWISRGKAVTRPFLGRFLEGLIKRGFESGSIDILRVDDGRKRLGYLYNVVYRDRVSNYQSGFQFGPTGRYKPGLVAHSLAVGHYASNTCLKKYSFLAGATQYKNSLSTGSEELFWYIYSPASRLMKLKKAIIVIATRLSS